MPKLSPAPRHSNPAQRGRRALANLGNVPVFPQCHHPPPRRRSEPVPTQPPRAPDTSKHKAVRLVSKKSSTSTRISIPLQERPPPLTLPPGHGAAARKKPSPPRGALFRQSDSSDFSCWYNLGRARAPMDRPDEAIDAIEHALRITTIRHETFNNLGNMYRQRSQADRSGHRHNSPVQSKFNPSARSAQQSNRLYIPSTTKTDIDSQTILAAHCKNRE